MDSIVSVDWREPEGDVNRQGGGPKTGILLLFLSEFQYTLTTLDLSIQVRLLFLFLIEKMQMYN